MTRAEARERRQERLANARTEAFLRLVRTQEREADARAKAAQGKAVKA